MGVVLVRSFFGELISNPVPVSSTMKAPTASVIRESISILILYQDLAERCLIANAGIMMTQRRLTSVVSIALAETTSLTDQLGVLEKSELLSKQPSTSQTGQ